MVATSFAAANLLLFIGVAQLFWRRAFRSESWQFSSNFRIQNFAQACVQCSVYLYLNSYSDFVKSYAPLIFYQICFAYIFDLIWSLTQHRSYRWSVSILPIVLSINLFIWFRPQYFYLQLAMVVCGIITKNCWRREIAGRLTHIFNPSGIALALASFGLLIAGAGKFSLIAQNHQAYVASRPGIFIFVFLVGTLSQYLGRVALITLGAFLTLFLSSSLCNWVTGMPLIAHWIDPSVLVGITLLITDPATTPRTYMGKFAFGCAYALSIIVNFGVLSYFGLPGYFLKILAVPFLNYFAPHFDRLTEGHGVREFSPRAQALAYSIVFLCLLPLIPKHAQTSFLASRAPRTLNPGGFRSAGDP